MHLGRTSKRGPKTKEFENIQEIQHKSNEDHSEFLERIYQTYRHYTDANPKGPKNTRKVNMNFIRQSAPDIRRKLQKLDGAFGMNLSQLVDIAFKVFNSREHKQKKKAQGEMYFSNCCIGFLEDRRL